MQSQFARTSNTKIKNPPLKGFETYNLAGLNLVAPDEIMPVGDVPHAVNNRSYAREVNDKRVAARKRKGSIHFSTPVGETLGASNTATVTAAEDFSQTKWLMEPFTATSSGLLTKIEVEVKKAVGAVGPVIVELLADNAGLPGQVLATSSILASTITTSFQFLPAYFMEAPGISSGTTYWRRIRVQTGSGGTYYVNKTAGSGLYSSLDGGATLTPLTALSRFKNYLSSAGTILGFARRYPTTLINKRTYFAMGQKLYEVTDAGVASEIGTNAISSNASRVRFEQVDDKLVFVDGNSAAQWYDGTTLSAVTGVTGTPTHVAAYNNRLWFVSPDNPNRIFFSDLGDYTTYASTSFLYASPPKSADAITGLVVFQNNLLVFTHDTKYIITEQGGGISTVTMTQAIGTKGAVSQEAIAVAKDGVYFMSSDGQVYFYNGISDKLVSQKVQPELSAIADFPKIRFHLYRNQLRIYYTKSPETYVTRMALYDTEVNQWFLDEGRYVMGSLEWTMDNGELIEFSSRCGVLFKGENGNSDVGKPITWQLWTPYYAFGSALTKKRIRTFRPFIRPSDVPFVMQIGKDVDFLNTPIMQNYAVDSGGVKWGGGEAWGGGEKWGAGIDYVDTRVSMSGLGKHIQFRFEETGVDTVPELYGFGLVFREGRPI